MKLHVTIYPNTQNEYTFVTENFNRLKEPYENLVRAIIDDDRPTQNKTYNANFELIEPVESFEEGVRVQARNHSMSIFYLQKST